MEKKLSGRKVGFIGLGVMGAPMAAHLAEAGAELVVHNRTRSKAEDFCGRFPEATVVNSPREVAEQCSGEVIFLMLTNSPAVSEVVLGEEGLCEALGEGTLLIDCSTTGLAVTKECAAAVSSLDCHWVDAPVSGGQFGAERGELTLMVGGSATDVENSLPFFEVIGKQITHVGETGAGQIAKLANQIIVAIGISALCEAFSLGKKAGVDPAVIRDAIRGGFAESRLLEEHGDRMVRGDFSPGGKAVLQLKDVREANQLMQDLNLDLPMLKTNLQRWETMVEKAGMGQLDHSGLFELYQNEQ